MSSALVVVELFLLLITFQTSLGPIYINKRFDLFISYFYIFVLFILDNVIFIPNI